MLKSHLETTLEIFSLSGAMLTVIPLPLSSPQADRELKKRITDCLLAAKRSPEQARRLLSRIRFPRQVPAVDWFTVQDNRLIARTYAFKEDQVEFVITDLQGRVQRRIFLPDSGRISFGIRFMFFRNHYFWLQDDPEEDCWVIYGLKIF